MASVVVVGGGVAGLACAWQLRRAGHDVEVLEREGAPGGRARSEVRDGFVLDRGARALTSGNRNVHAVAAALGLSAALAAPAHERRAVCAGDRLVALAGEHPLRLLASPLLSAAGKAGLARLAVSVARHVRQLDPLRPERAAALDGEELEAGLRRSAGGEATERLLLPLLDAEFGGEISHAFALLALRAAAAGARPLCLEGGMERLPRALAERVPVRAGCEVLAVETETDGARVRYRSGSRENRVYADAAVVAVPGAIAGALCPKLTPDERGFFESQRAARGLVVHLLLERPPPALAYDSVAFPRASGLELRALGVEHGKRRAAPAGRGLVAAFPTAAATARLWDAPDASIADFALERVAASPVGRLQATDYRVERWEHAFPHFEPGALRRLARFADRLDRSPRLAFAGDYLVAPSIEGALASGMRAATAIARGL